MRAEEIKPTRHQRALKMTVLKTLQDEKVKRRDTKWGLFFKFFSMSLGKKIVAGFGVVMIAIVVVVLWNPLVQKFGGKPTMTYAQEMLKLTREQFNALSPAERQKMAESIQEGALEEVWKEAEAAKDLEFYIDKKAQEIIFQDFIEFLEKTNPEYANHMRHDTRGPEDPLLRIRVFRFTDQRKNRVNITITSRSSPHEMSSNFANENSVFITPETTILLNRYTITPTKQRTHRTAEQLTTEEVSSIRQKFENRIQKNFPAIWKEITSASSTHFVIDSEFYSQTAKSHNIQMEFQERLEKLRRRSEQIISSEVIESSMDGGVNFEREGVVMLRYDLPDGRMGYVGTTIDLDFPERIISPLWIYRMK